MIYSIDIPDRSVLYDLDCSSYTALTATNLLTGESFAVPSLVDLAKLVENEVVLGVQINAGIVECYKDTVSSLIEGGIRDGRGFIALTVPLFDQLISLWHPSAPDMSTSLKRELYDKLIENGLSVCPPDSRALKFSLIYGVKVKVYDGLLLELRFNKSSYSPLPLYNLCDGIAECCVFDKSTLQAEHISIELNDSLLMSLLEHRDALTACDAYYTAGVCSKGCLVGFAITLADSTPYSKETRHLSNSYRYHLKGSLLAYYEIALLFSGKGYHLSNDMIEIYKSLPVELRDRFHNLVEDYTQGKYPVTKVRGAGIKYSKKFINFLDFKLGNKVYFSMTGLGGRGFDLGAYTKFRAFTGTLDHILHLMTLDTDYDKYICYLQSLSLICRLEHKATGGVFQRYLDYSNMHFSLLLETLRNLGQQQ